MTKRKTTEQFKQEVYDLVGDEYTILGEYIGNSIKLKVKHNKCGNVYEVIPKNLLHGSKCPKCSLNNKHSAQAKTTEQFKQEVYNLVNDEYSVLGEYKNTHTKIKMKHNKCDYEYEVRPHDFLRGSKCPYCSRFNKGKKNTKTNEQFKNEVYSLVNNEYTFLEHYVSATTKIKVKHNVCGNDYYVTPANFLYGYRCPFCNGRPIKNTESFKKDVYSLVGNDYSVLGTYINDKTKLRFKHNVCNFKYDVTPHDFLQGKRCPNCSISKGEGKIKSYLDSHQINYVKEQKFSWLKYSEYQRLDFYLPDYNLAIEYDGIQHFRPIDFSGKLSKEETLEQLKENKLRDRNKDKLCYQHGIKLIRIPYTQLNKIDYILNKELTN